MRGLTFLPGTWGRGEGARGRTQPDTKTAGLSPEWHPSHLSYPKPQMPACGLSTQQEAIPAYPGPGLPRAGRGAGGLSAPLLFSVGVP